jgi:hypothetical protein
MQQRGHTYRSSVPFSSHTFCALKGQPRLRNPYRIKRYDQYHPSFNARSELYRSSNCYTNTQHPTCRTYVVI